MLDQFVISTDADPLQRFAPDPYSEFTFCAQLRGGSRLRKGVLSCQPR